MRGQGPSPTTGDHQPHVLVINLAKNDCYMSVSSFSYQDQQHGVPVVPRGPHSVTHGLLQQD